MPNMRLFPADTSSMVSPEISASESKNQYPHSDQHETTTMNRASCFRMASLQALRSSLALLLLALFVTPAFGQVGGAAVVFLKIEPDSRSAGMGNAGVALADNASANFWNPAGLAFQEGTELGITHSNWLPEFNAGLFYEYLMAKKSIPGWGTVGAHITYLFLGEHEGRDAQNNPTGTFSSYDLAVGLSYGGKLSKTFSLGASARFIYSNLAPGTSVEGQETKAGVAVAFDVAGLYRSRPFPMGASQGTFSAGFNLANMGPEVQYSDSDQADPIPTNLRFGWAFTTDFDEFNKLTVVMDFNKDLIKVDSLNNADPFYKAIFSSWSPIEVRTNAVQDPNAEFETLSAFEQLTIGGGLEYWYNNLFALRGGYFYENPYNGNRKFLTLGAGIRYNIVGVDFSYIYALEENSPLANTMRFSLLLDFAR